MGNLHSTHAVIGNPIAVTLSLAALWFGMMAAMMAPVVWPWVLALRRMDLYGSASRQLVTAAFVAGYALTWLGYALAAAIGQVAIAYWTGIDTLDGLPSTPAGLVLMAAGLVQFTPLKRACLTHCRNPFSYLLARWHAGPMPPWRLGFSHGLFCVACCWALMATMLAVGMASLWWMVAITAATVAEQVAPRGDRVRVATGIALVAGGMMLAW